MRDSRPFLTRLGLDDQADARTIRRAYARELKLIDQEQEAARFQELRAAYETALNWADYEAHRRAAAANEAASEAREGPPAASPEHPPLAAPASDATPPAPDDPVPSAGAEAAPPPSAAANPVGDPQFEFVDPRELANRAFDAFTAACVPLTKGRMLHDLDLWQAELRRRLADDDLINMNARIIFEARIAHLLANGWHTGHETLFAAAAELFEWKHDRRRLLQFGYTGALLNRAIDERHMVDAQPFAERDRQRQILARVRTTAQPDADQLQRDMYYLNRMLTRFPAYMQVVASAENIARWEQMYAALPDQRAVETAGADTTSAPHLERDASPGAKLAATIALITAIIIATKLAGMLTAPAAPPAPFTVPAPAVDRSWPTLPKSMAPTIDYAPLLTKLDKLPPLAKPPAPVSTELKREILDLIRSHVHYRPGLGAELGKRQVEFDITLDADGNVSKLVKSKASIDVNYDDAVAAAIRHSHPYPASTPRRFSVYFSNTVFNKTPPPEE